jgi:hypothetical protein
LAVNSLKRSWLLHSKLKTGAPYFYRRDNINNALTHFHLVKASGIGVLE